MMSVDMHVIRQTSTLGMQVSHDWPRPQDSPDLNYNFRFYQSCGFGLRLHREMKTCIVGLRMGTTVHLTPYETAYISLYNPTSVWIFSRLM